MHSVLRVISYLKRYRFLFGAQLFCAVASVAFVFVFPKVLSRVIDVVIPEKRYEEFIPLVLLTLVGFFFKDGLNALRIVINNHFEQRVIFDVRSDLYKRIQNLPVKWFDTRRTGDVMTRVTEDVTAMERVLIDGVEQGLMAAAQIILVGTYLCLQDLTVGLWAMIPIPFLMLGAWVYTKNARDRYRGPREASSNMNALLHDNIAGIRQIKSYTAQTREHTRFNAFSEILKAANLRLMAWWAGYSPGMSFLSMLGYVVVLWQGGQQVLAGEMSQGDFVGALFLLNLFYDPIGKLHQINQMALSSRAAADRVFEILDAEEEDNSELGEQLPVNVKGHVKFEDVHFSYGEDREIIHDFTLNVDSGQTIALVGPTGAGKSTVVGLLNRFYEVSAGRIKIDGCDISQLSKESLRSSIGYVSQDNFLFNGSVRENLMLARDGATDEEIWTALEAAQAASFVRRMASGLETNVGERGVKLSGGEKQRLSIARAILKDPPILVLDEATASVDNETEELIQKALTSLLQDRTAFVIAHRLSTIRDADQIIVLDQGTLVEQGTHDELVNKNGLYSDLSRISQEEKNVAMSCDTLLS